MIDALRGHCLLEVLGLGDNDIGNDGCDTIATLLINPNCNLHALDLGENNITTEGAITIANSLRIPIISCNVSISGETKLIKVLRIPFAKYYATQQA